MEFTILSAEMSHSEEEGYTGKVAFAVAGHKEPYEMTLHSKKGKDWSYGLLFLKQPGDEEEIVAVEDWLEEDDEAYEQLVEAALNTLPPSD